MFNFIIVIIMAHFTGLKELQNKPHKSGHDISAKNCFTAKVGELLPVWTDFAIPNSTYRFNLEYFTRTRPVQTSAYTRIREYFDFFAVPCDLIWKSFDSAVIQMGEKAPIQSKDLLTNLTVKGDLPYCTLEDLSNSLHYAAGHPSQLGNKVSVVEDYGNIFGYNRGDVNHKLLTMLDYGNIVLPTATWIGSDTNRWWNMQSALSDSSSYSQKYNVNLAVNLFFLASYQKIYQDFFRWSQWENADPTSYNFDWYAGFGNLFGTSLSSSIPSSNDYWKRDNLFSLRYANWNKDKFMGILPNSQFGDLAVVDLGTAAISGSKIPVGAYDGINDTGTFKQFSTNQESFHASSGSNKATPIYPRFADNISVRGNANLWAVLGESPDLSLKFSVLALRQAEALQKWKEITQSVDTNYRDQIKAHFGVNVPQSESHMAKYIGGVARNLDISEVVNTYLPQFEGSLGENQAYIYGKGVGSGQGSMTFSTGSGYYILMCIYHAVPLLDYAISGPDGQNLVTSVEDLPIPEFDNIGMESVPAVELMNSSLYSNVNSADKILGYNPRYYNWKTKIDRIHGSFTTTLKDWVAPIDDSFLYSLFGGNLSIYKGVTWPFFKVNPNTLDDIFAVKVDSTWETDQLLVNCNVGCYVTRPLSADGVPY